jgi:SlyX protein
MATTESLDARVAELETRYMLQQDVIQQLSDVLWRQQQEVDALKQRVHALERRVVDGSTADAPAPDDDLPPHY